MQTQATTLRPLTTLYSKVHSTIQQSMLIFSRQRGRRYKKRKKDRLNLKASKKKAANQSILNFSMRTRQGKKLKMTPQKYHTMNPASVRGANQRRR